MQAAAIETQALRERLAEQEAAGSEARQKLSAALNDLHRLENHVLNLQEQLAKCRMCAPSCRMESELLI